ncbi:hypothetical protein NUV25_35050, partial [Burkholderia pseudomultivorans]|uniref:hypothetical protein n=1 Tax=Burkholderia pseudomultivorans TaxID=1207504 RepID=UPI002874FC3F
MAAVVERDIDVFADGRSQMLARQDRVDDPQRDNRAEQCERGAVSRHPDARGSAARQGTGDAHFVTGRRGSGGGADVPLVQPAE